MRKREWGELTEKVEASEDTVAREKTVPQIDGFAASLQERTTSRRSQPYGKNVIGNRVGASLFGGEPSGKKRLWGRGRGGKARGEHGGGEQKRDLRDLRTCWTHGSKAG